MVTEQDRQDRFVDVVGVGTADKLQRLWNSTYPRFCSIGDEYPCKHSKEEVFLDVAVRSGIRKSYVLMFLDL